MIKNIDVLNLEWNSFPSRDRQMASLVCNYLRYMGYSVVEGPIFHGYYLLNKIKPKLYFNASPLGAEINFKLMKYARSKGILGTSLISEGIFLDGKENENQLDNLNQFLWGNNKDKILYENIHMQWSEQTRNMSLKYYPELKDNIKISGGVGFDIYKILKHMSKSDFLEKYNKKEFSKIIGVGCWNFDMFYPGHLYYSFYKKLFSEEACSRFRDDGKKFNEILKSIIFKNKDILFLLKEHPGSSSRRGSAIEGTEDFSNVMILKHEESVANCINVSDFWISYDSTTTLEAWLLGKQTCLLNPSGTDFPRMDLYLGSPHYSSIEELQNAIDIFYKGGTLSHFNELENNRCTLITHSIQWDDGLNHVRAGNEIINLLERTNLQKLKKDTLKQFASRYWQMVQWTFSPYLKFHPKIKIFYQKYRDRFHDDELQQYQEKLMKEQIEFYKKNRLTKSDLKKITCI